MTAVEAPAHDRTIGRGEEAIGYPLTGFMWRMPIRELAADLMEWSTATWILATFDWSLVGVRGGRRR
jgi:hypothetical protein